MTHLDLSDNRLEGELPDSVGRLKKLKILDISYNNIRGEIPDSIGNLRYLTELYMGNNNLEGEIPKSLGELNQLTYLTLIENENLRGPEALHSLPIKNGAIELSCSLRTAELQKFIERKEGELGKVKKEQKRADDLRAEAKRYKLDLQEEELRERIHNKEVELNLIMKKKESLTTGWKTENANVVAELQQMVIERPLTKLEREKKANVDFLASRILNLPQFPRNRETVIEEAREMIPQYPEDFEKIDELITRLSDTSLALREYSKMSKEATEIFYITGIICGREAENAAYELGQRISLLQERPGNRDQIIDGIKQLVERSKNQEQKDKAVELCTRIAGYIHTYIHTYTYI